MIDCFNDWLLQYEWTTYFKIIILLSDEFQSCEANADQAASFPLGPGSIPATGSRSTHKVNKILFSTKLII